MTTLAFLGLIAMIVGLFYCPVPIAFLILATIAFEHLGWFAALCVIIGAIIYWIKEDPDGWMLFLNCISPDDDGIDFE